MCQKNITRTTAVEIKISDNKKLPHSHRHLKKETAKHKNQQVLEGDYFFNAVQLCYILYFGYGQIFMGCKTGITFELHVIYHNTGCGHGFY